MTFKEWESNGMPYNFGDILADWKTEREVYMSINPKEYDWVKENTKLITENAKLMSVLYQIEADARAVLEEIGEKE